MKLFIFGAPGVGKTTFSRYLKIRLNYPLVELDYLREIIAQLDKTEKEDPFLYVGTKEAWRKFADLNKDNVIKGLNAVRSSMNSYVMNEISLYDSINVIFEGAFIIPEEFLKLGKVILVTSPNEEKHRKQYFEHRDIDENTLQGFKASRLLQEEFIRESEGYDIEIIKNEGNMKEIVSKLSV